MIHDMTSPRRIDPTRPKAGDVTADETIRVMKAENGWVIRYGGRDYNAIPEKIAVATSPLDLMKTIADILGVHNQVFGKSGILLGGDEAPF